MKIIKVYLLLLFALVLSAQEPPNAPSNLHLKALSSSSVLMSWRDNSDNESGFKIFRDNRLIYITKKNVEQYIDKNLQPNTTYRYEIKATNDDIVTKTKEFMISSSSDDSEELSNGYINNVSSDLEMVKDGKNKQIVGLRFSMVHIPQDTIINSAYIQFETDEVSLEDTSLKIYLEATDNSKPLTNSANDLSSKSLLSISKEWHPEAWSVIGERSSKQATPDLSRLIQKVVDDYGWVDGNALTFIIEGEGKRVAKSFDGNGAPSLIINYTQNQTQQPNDGNLIISEVLSANSYTKPDPDFKEYSDYIELYNGTNGNINIGDYYLSNDKDKINKWKVPKNTVIKSKEYLLIWADKKSDGNNLHSNFKISQKGATVTLANRAGNLIDSIEFSKQDGDISVGKLNGEIIYMDPTPNRKNSKAYDKLVRSKKPTFAISSGFYDTPQTIELSQKNGGSIYYTTDGSIPTTSSKLYSSPIYVDKTTVIRARSLEDGKFMSNVKNQTYLINENITLPVVSIAVDNSYLYDKDIGIFENYKMNWKRAAGIEYFDGGESKFSENIAIRVSGGYTRVFPQKSISIYAKNKYGPKSIKYALFKDKPGIKKIKSFKLRNSGNNWRYSMMKDALAQSVVKDNMDIDYQSYQPSVVFINGQYWGIMNIREKVNEDYFEMNYDVDEDDLELLEGKYHKKAGDNKEYLKLISFIETSDLSIDENYQYIASKIDVDEYINYMITELYGGNLDWPYANIKYWRDKKNNTKWRWVLYDLDFTYADGSNVNKDPFKRIMDDSSTDYRNAPWSTLLFRSLMSNAGFKNMFTTRFSTHLNTTFQPDRVGNIITSIKNKIKPEMARFYTRWPNAEAKIDLWESGAWYSIEQLYHFANKRESILRDYLKSNFNVDGSAILSLDLDPMGGIYVDGVELSKNYNGQYFIGAKVKLKAVPYNGHTFVQWSNGNTNPEIEIILDRDTSIQAEFN
jgi:hypothetical protein